MQKIMKIKSKKQENFAKYEIQVILDPTKNKSPLYESTF